MRKTWHAHVYRQEGGLSNQPSFVLFYDVKPNSFFVRTSVSIHLFTVSKMFRECIHIFSQHTNIVWKFIWINTFISMQNSKRKVIGLQALPNILNDDCDIYNRVTKLCLYYFPTQLINKCAYKAMWCLRDVITERIFYCSHLLTKLDMRMCDTQQNCPYLKSPSCHSVMLNGRDIDMNRPKEQGIYVYRHSDYFFCN